MNILYRAQICLVNRVNSTKIFLGLLTVFQLIILESLCLKKLIIKCHLRVQHENHYIFSSAAIGFYLNRVSFVIAGRGWCSCEKLESARVRWNAGSSQDRRKVGHRVVVMCSVWTMSGLGEAPR